MSNPARVPARPLAGTRRSAEQAIARQLARLATELANRPGYTPCAAGCGWPVDPASRAGADGTPEAFDRHPGCEPVRAAPLARPRPRTIQPRL